MRYLHTLMYQLANLLLLSLLKCMVRAQQLKIATSELAKRRRLLYTIISGGVHT